MRILRPGVSPEIWFRKIFLRNVVSPEIWFRKIFLRNTVSSEIWFRKIFLRNTVSPEIWFRKISYETPSHQRYRFARACEQLAQSGVLRRLAWSPQCYNIKMIVVVCVCLAFGPFAMLVAPSLRTFEGRAIILGHVSRRDASSLSREGAPP